MKTSYLFLLFLLFHLGLYAQTTEKYASVRISLREKSIAELNKCGIETDHGQYYPGRSITTVLSGRELLKVRQAGFETEVLIDDLSAHYLEQRGKPQPATARGIDCNEAPPASVEYVTPANYTYGTMGGYLTYDQMMAELDKMRTLYPNLISVRKITSDTILTWDGNPIYHVRISDNPDEDEAEREVLYTALHHAREPNSASQLIFYMWYLLENYDSRPDIKALVDNLEMYFIPCINVDGYKYNESLNPGGGGYWRKNRRDNGDGSFGIDLNRNYGYFWGELGGSSADPFSEIYRGPEAFSEPESRTIRDFCLAHDFLFVYNYHTAGNLFIYPWSYNDMLSDSAYIKYARHFTRENHYTFGTPSQTVGYTVNGSSDDWMYAEKGSYSITPEVGKTGFWPQPEEIDQLNKDNLWQNLSMAYSALRYGEANDLDGPNIIGSSGAIDIEFMRYGLQEGPVTVSLLPFSANISSATASHDFDLAHLQRTTYSFDYQLNQAIQTGDEVIFLLKTDNGFWVKTDTLRKTFVPGSEATGYALQDSLNDSANWNTDWQITTEAFHSAPSCITESPNAPYQPNQVSICEQIIPVIIPGNALNASLRFFAKWDIENDWDYNIATAYGSGGTSRQLCGLYTQPGANVQPEGPVFDGQQFDWVEERMDISDFIGQAVQIYFLFASDGFQEADGFYFDDLRIEYSLPVSGMQIVPISAFRLLQNVPNPAEDRTIITWNNEGGLSGASAMLRVFDMLGDPVLEKNLDPRTEKSISLDTRGLAPGIYTYCLENEHFRTPTMKMCIARK